MPITNNAPDRLYRCAAIFDWCIAVLVSMPCTAMLYSIRAGKFHNSNWVDPRSWAQTMELGLGLSALCAIAGLWLWVQGKLARWLESVLAIPKLYCAWIALFLFFVTNSWLFLSIIIVIITSVGLSIVFWVPTRGRFEQEAAN